MMEFSFLAEQGAIRYEPVPGVMGDTQTERPKRYVIDYKKMPDALDVLAKQLLDFEARGDRQGAEAWFTKYGVMPQELMAALKTTSDIPVDIEPIFSFPRTVR
jgi:hypothetical protein